MRPGLKQQKGSDVPEVPEGLGENLLGHNTNLDLTEAGISHH